MNALQHIVVCSWALVEERASLQAPLPSHYVESQNTGVATIRVL
jgi:hypothetical protein